MNAGFYALVYIGWMLGIVLLAVSIPVVRGLDASSRGLMSIAPTAVIVGGAIVLVGSMFFPWLRGLSSETGSPIELNGWEGNDGLSNVFVVLASASLVGLTLVVGRPSSASHLENGKGIGLVIGMSACLSFVVCGNLGVRLTEPGGPRIATAHIVGAVAAQLPLVAGPLQIFYARRRR